MKTLLSILSSRTVGIALAILAAMALSSSRAEAACGDYVHIAKTDSAETAPTPLPKPPCDGPNCSNRQTPPVAPLSVPTVESEVSKPLAKLAEAFDPAAMIRVSFSTRSSLALPEPFPSSIFHPPRSI